MLAIVLLAAALSMICLLPGAAAIAWAGGAAHLPRWSAIPAALALSIAACAVATGVAFLVNVSQVVSVWAVTLLAACLLVARTIRDRRVPMPRMPATGLTAAALALILVVMVVTVAGGGAPPRGGRLSDSLFHMGIITKLSGSSVVDTQQLAFFSDGIPHPTYILPVWHAMLAAAHLVSGADLQLTLDVATAVVAAVAVLAWIAIGRALLPNDALALTAATGMVVFRIVSTAPGLRLLQTIAYPGNIVFEVLVPLAFASFLWAVRKRAPRTERVWGCVMAAVVSGLVVLLHANYAVLLALAGVGYLVVRACQWRWREDWPLHRWAVLAPAAVTLVVGVPLLLSLRSLERFGRGTGEQALGQVQAAWSETLRLAGDRLVMDIDHYLGLGGLAFVGLAAAATLAWMRHARSAQSALIIGIALAVFAVSLWPAALTFFSGIGDVAFVARSHRMLLLMPAIVMVAAIISPAITRRRQPLALASALSLGVWAATNRNGLSGQDQFPVERYFVPEWALWGLVGLLVAGVLSWMFRHTDAAAVQTRLPVAVALCLLVFAPSAVTGAVRLAEAEKSRDVVEASRVALRLPAPLQSEFAKVRRDTPYGYHVVAADPGLAYSIQAYFPVKVTAVSKLNVASGGTMSNQERVEAWNAASNPAAHRRDAERFLAESGATIVMPLPRSHALQAVLERAGSWKQLTDNAWLRIDAG